MNAKAANSRQPKLHNVYSGSGLQETGETVLNESKRQLIAKACEKEDLDSLVRLADSEGGLLDDALRRTAWPILLGCQHELSGIRADGRSWKSLPKHRDEDQVHLDVNRAFVYYPNDESEKELDRRKEELFDLIVQVIRRHPMLCYFQGYHDIVQVFLLVLGKEAAVSAVARVSLLRIRDYMLPTLSPALKHLHLLPPILELSDPALAKHLSQTRPFFALSATLTLYAHDIQEYGDIARLFDFILAHEPVIALYTFAAIILSRRVELLEIPINEPEMLHFTLSKLPQPLDLEALITSTLELFRRHPPERMPHFQWWRIPSASVLKTSRSLKMAQSLRDGERLFESQRAQMQREEFQQKVFAVAWKYRRPIGSVTVALLVGAVSIWLRRSGNEQYVLSAFSKLSRAILSTKPR